MINIIPQSEVRLLKTPLEKDEEHTLSWSSLSDQTSYMLSKVQNSYSDFTYVRENNTIVVPANYDTIYTCNYLMYKNNGFNNKYFYAFITKMEYVSENSTRIYFEIDSLQTWYYQINYNNVFVEREHVDNDTIGLHTLPEDIEHGEYIMASNFQKTNLISNYAICIEATAGFESGGQIINLSGGTITNRVFSGVSRYYFKDDVEHSGVKAWVCAQRFIREFDDAGKGESIVGIYMVPESYTSEATWREITTGSGMYFGVISNSFLYENAFPLGTFSSITTPSTLAGNYTPRNNKLFTFPYRYCLISNNAGVEIPFHYENFSSSSIAFDIYGAVTPGCDIKLIPLNYKGITENVDEAISLAKLPVCSWSSDMYTNWLTQTSLNRTFAEVESGVKLISGGAQLVAGSPTGLGDVSAGINGIKNVMVEKYEHSFLPSQAKGNTNAGNINFALDYIDYTFYHYSIKPEYARIIDEYFTKYGYKVNRVKTPNIGSRRNFNYIKTIGCNFTGDIPQEDLQKIKNLFNNGITFWHNAENFLNYSVNNDII